MDDLSPEARARLEEAAKNRNAVRELWDLLKVGQREIHELEAQLAAVEAERDHAIANLVQAHDRWAGEEQRATRLVALEAAARAWAAVFTTGPAQEPWCSPWQAMHDAVRALDAPPGESP